MRGSDLPASLGLVAFGVFVFYESWRMPRFEKIGGTIYSAPGLVPGALGIVIALLGVLMLVRYLVARRAAAAPAPEAATGAEAHGEGPDAHYDVVGDESSTKVSNARFLWTAGLTIVFAVVLVGRMPFWLATFLFVFTYIVVFERAAMRDTASTLKTLVVAGAIAGAAGFAVPFVFERIFLVNLP